MVTAGVTERQAHGRREKGGCGTKISNPSRPFGIAQALDGGLVSSALRRLVAPSLSDFLEGLACRRKHGALAGEGLPAPDRHIAIVRIDLGRTRPTAGLLGGDQDRTRAWRRRVRTRTFRHGKRERPL